MGSIDPLDEKGDVFLIPGEKIVKSREDACKWAEEHWNDFFDFQLGKWVIDDQLRPKNRRIKILGSSLILSITQ